MNIDDLVEQILTLDRQALRGLLEEALPLGKQHSLLLYRLRDQVFDTESAWRTTFVAARMAPAPFALSTHLQGRALNMHKGWEASIWPLTIAHAAYHWSGDSDGAARAGATLADSLYICSQYDEAQSLALAAQAIFLREGKQREAAKCQLTIASVYADRLDGENARRAYEMATAILNAADTTLPSVAAKLADAYIGMGSMLEKLLDDFEAADAAYAQAEAILASIRDQVSASHAQYTYFRLAINRAILLLRLGRHTDARRALDQAEGVLPPEDKLNLFEVWLYRGYQLLLLGDRESAGRLLDQAWQTVKQLAYEYPQLKARLAEQQVRAAVFAGYRRDILPSTALTLLDEAADLCEELAIQLWPAIIATEQARAAYTDKRFALAHTYLQHASELLRTQSPPPYRRLLELKMLSALHDEDMELMQLDHLAQELRQIGDYPACAEILTHCGTRAEKSGVPDHAYRAYLAALDVLDQARSAVRLSPQSIQFLARRRRSYERAFALATQHDAIMAFEVSERARAQGLLDDIANQGLHALLDRDNPQLARLRTLRLALERAYARTSIFRVAQYRAVVANETAAQRSEREQAEAAYAEELLSLQAAGSDEASWIRGKIATIATIQSELAPDTVLIAYLRVEDTSGERHDLWATALTANGAPIVQKIATYNDLDGLLITWDSCTLGQPEATLDSTQGVLARVYRLFLSPFDALLATHQRVIVIPDETLPLLPLHAAYDRNRGYLVESHIVSYAPSASVLVHCQQRERGRAACDGVVLAGWAGPPEHHVPQVKRELADLAALFKTEPHHGPLSVNQTLALMASARLIHLACHGVFPPDAPLFAHLLIGHQPLYAHDLYGQSLHADMLTLSACDIGQHGVGLQGLVSAGLVAGANSVLASMWPAHDRATALLMRHFYHNLIDLRMGRADALCMAQRALLRDPLLADPSLWAAFFLTGVPGPLDPPLIH